ncbi:MAG: transposase [Myxococcales bacterium]|nr:transposase [Myxococcales bacterium]
MTHETEIRIPPGWTEIAKSGLVNAVALARLTLLQVLSGFENGRAPKARLLSVMERLRARIAQLESELAVKDRRMTQLAPAKRPHYSPPDRLQILLLMAATGWTLAETARRFLVSAPTIANWKKRLDEQGEAALVRLAAPVNRFPDYVREVVRGLKRSFPSMGRQRLADTLAREGLVLAASTVRRITLEVPPMSNEPEPSDGEEFAREKPAEPSRAKSTGIAAWYYGHVWHCDLTVVPTSLGFWLPWFPFCVWLGWPFAYWVVGVVDQYTRAPIKLKAFKRQPSSRDVRRFLNAAIQSAGKAPKHLITDRGVQFQADYRAWCNRLGIKPRWGAVGSHKSIAIIERFWRSMKAECCRQFLTPLKPSAMQAELDCYAAWFRLHRPHRALQGITPHERVVDNLPDRVRFEPRPKMPIRGDPVATRRVSSVELRVEHFAGRRHLPVIHLEAA